MSKQIAIRLASIPVVLAATAGTALAALPENVTTEANAYKTDALAALALIIGAGVAIWGLRKLGQKLGWL